MFQGSIPPEMQQMAAEHIGKWKVTDLHVGCSGNFTVERAVLGTSGDRFRLHGCDVSIYTSAHGFYFTGQPLQMSLNPDMAEEYAWLADYLQSPEDILATVRLLSAMGAAVDGKNAYWRRVRNAYIRDWPDLHAKNVKRLVESPFRLASYHNGDVIEWIKTLPRDSGFVSYPPFYAKGYEAMFNKIEKVLKWDEPPDYKPIDDARRLEYCHMAMEFKHWILGLMDRVEEFEPYLKGVTQTTNRGVPIYLYSNSGPTRIVTPRQELALISVPRLSPGQELGEKLTIVQMTHAQFAALRSKYLNAEIPPATASVTCGVLVDGILVGVFAFSTSPTLSNWDAHIEGPTTYLLSDFPVAPTDYPRLSKLIVYAALSREAKMLVERYSNRRVRGLATTAHTHRPVSMKYRGILRLFNRKEGMINYGAPMGEWTAQEGYEIWRKKHGKRVPFQENARQEAAQ